MAVEVTTHRYSNGKGSTDTHPDAVTFIVRDNGHLALSKTYAWGAKDSLAVYSPGAWLSARVIENPTE